MRLPPLCSTLLVTVVLVASSLSNALAQTGGSSVMARRVAPSPQKSFVSIEVLFKADLDTLTVLDARAASEYNRGHLPGAVRVSWLDHRDGWGRTGKLKANTSELARDMAALGVQQQRSVVVYGAAREGWGEEGRIAWMLQYLGHNNVFVLDGGYAAWTVADGLTTREAPRVERGTFVADIVPELRASADAVAEAASRGVIVLDTRGEDEWNGSRRYFPPRTGRIPDAVHLHWADLLAPDGRLDRSDAAMARLRAKGLKPNEPVIAYCVGGVRSAFVVLALRELGFVDVRNYDGSWYEWSADRLRPVEKP